MPLVWGEAAAFSELGRWCKCGRWATWECAGDDVGAPSPERGGDGAASPGAAVSRSGGVPLSTGRDQCLCSVTVAHVSK